MAEPDRFEREAMGWIRQELKHDSIDLERLEFKRYRHLSQTDSIP
jgi:hypothetical protein